MMYRFSQAEQIGNIIVRDSLRQLGQQIDFTAQEGMPILVYNPLGWPRNEMATGDLDFEVDDLTADDFQVINSQGQRVPHQVLSDEAVFWMETLKANRKRRVRVAFQADVPALGYAAYYIQPAQAGEKNLETNEWKIRSDGAENRYLSFQIESDGGLKITDKTSGVAYQGLHHFEDVEDAGDEYSYCPSRYSQKVSTLGEPASMKMIASGDNLVTFEVNREMTIPESLSEDRQMRSDRKVVIPIRSRITLYRTQPGLYIETEIENRARDHKLSVMFPVHLTPARAFVDESFAVLPREIDLPDSEGWVEDPTPLMHQRSFIDLNEMGHGLAVLNRGLPAVEVTRQPEGTLIDLVLLRCVGWLSRDDLTTRRVAAGPLAPAPGAQCPGKFCFEYAIFPHAGDWKNVYPAAYAYDSPLLVSRADTHEGLNLCEMNITRDDPAKVKSIPWRRAGTLPDRFSFVAADNPALVLSSIHRTVDGKGIIVRFYNIASENVLGSFKTGRALEEVWLTNMNEERGESVPLIDEDAFQASFKGQQVLTFELRFKPFM